MFCKSVRLAVGLGVLPPFLLVTVSALLPSVSFCIPSCFPSCWSLCPHCLPSVSLCLVRSRKSDRIQQRGPGRLMECLRARTLGVVVHQPARRAMSKWRIVLLPSGATSNESLHAEINSWTRVNREVHRSTLHLKLNIVFWKAAWPPHRDFLSPRKANARWSSDCSRRCSASLAARRLGRQLQSSHRASERSSKNLLSFSPVWIEQQHNRKKRTKKKEEQKKENNIRIKAEKK